MKKEDEIVRLKGRIEKLENELAGYKERLYFQELDNKDLSVQKEHLQIIAEFANDWEFWLDPQGNYKYISPSCQNVTGFSVQEFMQKPSLIYQVVFSGDQEEYRNFIHNTLNFTTIGGALEFRILTRSKQLRWCELKCKAVHDSRGKYLGQRGLHT